jgi:hypothetical protein
MSLGTVIGAVGRLDDAHADKIRHAAMPIALGVKALRRKWGIEPVTSRLRSQSRFDSRIGRLPSVTRSQQRQEMGVVARG